MKPLKAAEEFSPELEPQVRPEEESLIAPEPVEVLPRRRRMGLWGKALLASGVLLLLTETGLTLMRAWGQSPWLFGLYALFVSLALGGLLTLAGREVARLRRLRNRHALREQLQPLVGSEQMGAALPLLEGLKTELPGARERWPEFERRRQPHHSDAELLALADGALVAPLDQQAEAIIYRYSAQAAVMLAASPLAVMDMALMLWRNQRMLDELSRLYGVEPGYLGRLSLVRQMLVNLIYAGGSELVLDLGGQLLTAELTGKLSGRVAQGLGAGMLTARLGYQAQALCRPLPQVSPRPRLIKVQVRLLGELTRWSAGALKRARETVDRNK
ncbi:TIGR01620 family protein [Ferrimonas sediminicola]|uniref:TIGR01620 family protein n=1 Tax=Ferrimonas sediminicola TaxID=2569538 RepID=A0A4U1B9S2_9GAMM|nr:TIGR01620 family protein [Ferrimonas sediminicola]TKB46849.1 TIGR01620 family protein [Ferrimonas sediminicola]